MEAAYGHSERVLEQRMRLAGMRGVGPQEHCQQFLGEPLASAAAAGSGWSRARQWAIRAGQLDVEFAAADPHSSVPERRGVRYSTERTNSVGSNSGMAPYRPA